MAPRMRRSLVSLVGVSKAYGRPSPSTTRAFFGNGSYALDGNTMVMTRDDYERSTFFFRVQQASDDSGRTWKDELCLLTPGSSGEVCYRKE